MRVFFVISLCMVFMPTTAAHASERPDGAPRIANWNFKWSIDSDEEVATLAAWDVLIIDVENERFSRERLAELKELNPDIVLLAYISMTDIRPDAADLAEGTARRFLGEKLEENPEWIVQLASGKKAEWWPTYDIMNISTRAPKVDGEQFNDFFADFVRDAIVKDDIWDGVFFDNLWEEVSFVSDKIDLNNDGTAEKKKKANLAWSKGVKKILKQTKKAADKNRKNFIITGNGGTKYYRYLNGVGLEHFPSTVYGGWTSSMEEYFSIMRLAARDQYSIINTNVNNSGDKTNYKKFRYGLTSSLMDDGYYSFDNGDQTHRERWYYDEYDTNIGEAVSGAYNVLEPKDPATLRAGVWRRDYENATVLVNSTSAAQKVTFNTGFEKIKGTQDKAINSGDVIGSVTIPAEDGIIVLRRLSQVRDSTFINGAFSKVFDGNGTEMRNSFFAYDGSFPGGVQIHKISSSGRSVVAGKTRVDVYNSQNQKTASFAPYGDAYADGINIAVGTLYGGTKTYIVTGPKKGGAHVRIFDIDGNLTNAGCNPYPPGFNGGVNVAVGDLNGDKRLEIVVAAGFGGGPHIRILNNNCDVINPGFFAFDNNLRLGVNLAVGDLNGDGKSEIIAASGPGGGPHVRIFNKNGKLLSSGFFAYEESGRSGVLVSTADTNKDGIDEIVTSSFAIFNQ